MRLAHHTRRARALLVVGALATTAGLLPAQQEPVATMFRDDLKREEALALSFLPVELPAAGAASSLRIYLSAGDLERAFDRPQYRPDAAIIPTNTDLVITAAAPTTQRVLTARVSKHAPVMADLQDQIAARRKQPLSPGSEGVLQIGVDAFVAQLPRGGGAKGPFPRLVCFVATDFATGGAIDRRELFSQDRVRRGIADCLTGLDQAGAVSVLMPLLGSASAKTQSKDPVFEGQRRLQECRQLNAAAGIALGIHDFASKRRTVHEIGIVQWDREIADMFRGGRIAQSAYRVYAEQIKLAVNKGLAGDKTSAADLDGNCAATFNAASPGR